MFALMIAAAASLVAPAEELKEPIQAAIWADLQMNAMIGNGNRLASLWFNVGSDTGADLHIQSLTCAQTRSGQRCSFDLVRDGGEVAVLGEAAPDRLTCAAALNRADDNWAVVHEPARRRGHSQTSMQCAVPKT